MNSLSILLNGAAGHRLIDDQRPSFALAKSADLPASPWRLELSSREGECLWVSEDIPFHRSLDYGGPPLLPRRVYRLRAWLQDDAVKSAEVQGSFETGFLGGPWEARWIEPDQEDAVLEGSLSFGELFAPKPEFLGGQDRLRPCQDILKTFSLDRLPEFARIYATAHGLYELRVNGRALNAGAFSPEFSPYSKRLYYQAYDIAPLLNLGENRLELTLADGWWIGRIGLSGDSCQYGNRLACLVQGEFRFTDGEQRVMGSDESFLGRPSSIDYADLFIGQRQDFHRRAGEWVPCGVCGTGTDNLVAQSTDPIETWAE